MQQTICNKSYSNLYFCSKNTPGTAGGPGGRDRTLAVKSRKNAKKSILGETNFQTQEFP